MYRALIVPNWPKWQSLYHHYFTKNDHKWNIFSNVSSGQQYFSKDIKKFRQKWLIKKSKFVWRKKPTLSTNIPLLSYRKSEQLQSYFIASLFFLYLVAKDQTIWERWWSSYVSASQSKGRMIEAHHYPCLLLEITQPRKITKKLHVILKQGHNSGLPWWAVQLLCWSFPSWINGLNIS